MTDTPLPFDPIAEARRNWQERGWGEADRMAAVTSVMRAHQILIAAVNRELAPLDLTFARYEVLVLLVFSRRGALPLGKIGERLQVHAASVTNAIDRLEGAGFVRRRPHPTDGRAVLAEITAEGRDVVDRATQVLVAGAFGAPGLERGDAEELTRLLAGLREAAGDFTP